MSLHWRLAALSGVTAGVAIAPLAGGHAGLSQFGPSPVGTALAGLIAVAALAALRPGSGVPGGFGWLALVALVAALAGLIGGAERLATIDGGALDARAGTHAEVTGFVAAVPRRSHGLVRVRVQTPAGRLLVESPEPVADLSIGAEIAAYGVIRDPPDYYAAYLRRNGIRKVLTAGHIRLTGSRRGGLAAITDGIRDRAGAALERGMPEPESALARGMVLGQDDRIDPGTIDDFKRSGLAHLLAVSGQNVVLLAMLAMPLLAAAGLMLRARLLCVLVLIAIYVPVTGAGASIQRAGAMGAAGVVAALAGRPRSRWYAVLLAAFVTLTVNPRASGDVGWQLSFAAVLGILLWGSAIRDLVAGALGPGPVRGALAEGAAMTIAATVATAPLMAAHFDRFSLSSLPANVLALPAVAPAMWLGMLAAAAGQVPAIPVEPLNALNSLLVAYVAQVGHWFGAPGWSVVSVRLPGPLAVGATYCGLAVVMWVAPAALLRRMGARRAGERSAVRLRRPWRAVRPGLALLVAATVATGGWLSIGSKDGGAAARHGLVVRVLDVGQGDSILLQPADGAPVLVDGGPPSDDLGQKLHHAGVTRLAAAIVTHDQSDHVGGIEQLLGQMSVGTVVYAEVGRDLLTEAVGSGARLERVAEGSDVRSGSLDLEVLWPPREVLASAGAPGGGAAESGGVGVAPDPNLHAIVLLARWHDFSMLLTADAEAESVPIDPGPIDVLKIAHHGSVDAGLDALLDRTAPKLAVISVGAGNSYGHPTPETLATLSEHHVPTLRTDQSGTVTINVDRGASTVNTSG